MVRPGLSTNHLIRRLRQSAFLRNVLVVMSGTAVAQAVGFALSPVISRLFSPADFGVFGGFNAVTGVIAAFVTFDYSQAIMLPKQREDAGQVFLLSCLVTFGVSLLCLLACLILPGWFKGLLQTANGWLLGLLVLAVLVGGLNASFQAWCVRVKAFKQTSTSQVVRGLSSNGLQVGLGFLKAGAPGLIISSVLANFVASLNLFRVVRAELRGFMAAARWARLKSLAWEYRDFPQYSATASLINSLSLGLPVILLTHFYGLTVAGSYAFAMRLIGAPMSLVLTALRQVLFQKAAEAYNEGRQLTRLYLKITLGLFGVGLFPSLVLVAFAPRLFAWVFGGHWLQAGSFASSLVIWLLFMFCNVPAALFARILRLQRQLFLLGIILLAARTACLYLGGRYSFPPAITIFLFSTVGGIMNLSFICIVGFKLWRRESRGQAVEFVQAQT
ncbi:MAG: colanic acid exporter [Verrucomicrobia bacterium ADurb.Bin118]|nr:MAG: colanic acid exporter [Verrucomicrobia bacterium ADurb.Bin118]